VRKVVPQHGERGFTLLTTGICATALIGMLGLAVDLGRMYITRNELQAFTDSSSTAAALELDATSAGLDRARSKVTSSSARWNFGTTPFSNPAIEFSKLAGGPWHENPVSAAGYRYVRVRADATVPLYFMPILAASQSSTLAAHSIAGQQPVNSFRQGLFPFSPVAHVNNDPNFGFTPGQQYTLRWPSNSKTGNHVCAGDNADQWIDKADARGGSERGYIEDTSASAIRKAIEDDFNTHEVVVGGTLNLSGGTKETERDSLINRANQDADKVAGSYAEYHGNGRRLVVVPVNTGPPDNVVLGFGSFFLAMTYDKSGNEPFCAEYVGPYVAGSGHQGAGTAGAYEVKLVE
jgi:Flp pilus assembly protein TadG